MKARLDDELHPDGYNVGFNAGPAAGQTVMHLHVEACIVAAFVQESGLARVRPAVHGALARGANVRVLTGDYLDITQASALELLLDWQRAYAGNDSEEDTPAGVLRDRQERDSPNGLLERQTV